MEVVSRQMYMNVYALMCGVVLAWHDIICLSLGCLHVATEGQLAFEFKPKAVVPGAPPPGPGCAERVDTIGLVQGGVP